MMQFSLSGLSVNPGSPVNDKNDLSRSLFKENMTFYVKRQNKLISIDPLKKSEYARRLNSEILSVPNRSSGRSYYYRSTSNDVISLTSSTYLTLTRRGVRLLLIPEARFTLVSSRSTSPRVTTPQQSPTTSQQSPTTPTWSPPSFTPPWESSSNSPNPTNIQTSNEINIDNQQLKAWFESYIKSKESEWASVHESLIALGGSTVDRSKETQQVWDHLTEQSKKDEEDKALVHKTLEELGNAVSDVSKAAANENAEKVKSSLFGGIQDFISSPMNMLGVGAVIMIIIIIIMKFK